MKAIIEKVQNAIESVKNGYSSKYINIENPFDNSDWTIRVSNHGANPSRIDENTISLVVVLPEQESDELSQFSINKKSFRSINNQFFLNEDGDFTENFSDLEECLEYVLN